MKLLPIFGNSPSGNRVSFFFQHIGQFIVGVWVLFVFVSHTFFQYMFDFAYGELFAFVGGLAIAEEES